MESTNIVQDLQNSALKMTGWLKFVGIVTIVSGALAALSVIGIVFAWIPIWLGVLLMQAAVSGCPTTVHHTLLTTLSPEILLHLPVAVFYPRHQHLT